MRLLWIFFGSLSLGLGVLGAVLPVLPTTPFVLLAAFCYARGSHRLHRMLLDSRMFGPMIADWQAEGAISRRARYTAAATMLAVLVFSVFMGVPGWVLAIQAVCMGGAATYVLTRPLPARDRQRSSRS